VLAPVSPRLGIPGEPERVTQNDGARPGREQRLKAVGLGRAAGSCVVPAAAQSPRRKRAQQRAVSRPCGERLVVPLQAQRRECIEPGAPCVSDHAGVFVIEREGQGLDGWPEQRRCPHGRLDGDAAARAPSRPGGADHSSGAAVECKCRRVRSRRRKASNIGFVMSVMYGSDQRTRAGLAPTPRSARPDKSAQLSNRRETPCRPGAKRAVGHRAATAPPVRMGARSGGVDR
jgi:hypothetical protein